MLAIHVMIEYLSNKGDTKGEFHGEILRFEAATTGINARLSDGVEGMQGNLRETFLGASRDFNLAMADHKKKMDVLVNMTLETMRKHEIALFDEFANSMLSASARQAATEKLEGDKQV